MRLPNRMMPHGGLVAYEVATGQTGRGKAVSAPVVPERANIQERRRLVKGSAAEVVSNATVWLDPEHNVPVGSKVTIWRGTPRERVTEVLQTAYWEQGPGLPEHVELLCT